MEAQIGRLIPIGGILVVLLLAFYPVFQGKIPLNGRNLVSFYSPWYFEKFPGYPAGIPSKPGMLDQVRQFYPYMAFTQRMYQSGNIPLWNPHNFSGNPHAAEWQSSIFYPLQMLLLVLPLESWWTIYQMSGFFLNGLFTYAYLRSLKLSRLSAFFGGVTFMLSGFMSVWNMGVFVSPHTIIWLPLILLSVNKVLELHERQGSKKATTRWWLVGLTALVLSILAGFWQTTFYVILVSFIYTTWAWRKRRHWEKTPGGAFRILIPILLWVPAALLVVSFYMFPSFELFRRSGRVIINSSENYQQYLLGYLLSPRHLVTLLAPDYFGHPTTRNYFAVMNGSYYEQVIYVGIIPLVLAGIGIIARTSWRGVVKFWLGLVGMSLLFGFDTPLARLIYQLHLPVISTSIPNRILFVSAFGLSVLAAIGMEIIAKANSKLIKQVFRFFVFLFVLVGLQAVIWKNGLGVIDVGKQPKLYVTSLRNLVLPFVSLATPWLILEAGFQKIRKQTIFPTVLVLLTIGQSLYQHHKFTAFSEKQFIFPRHSTIDWLVENAQFDRFTGYNGKYLEDNFATYFGLYSTGGYDALNDFRRSQLLSSSVTGRLTPGFMTASDAIIDYDLTNLRTLRLMQLLGIRYLVDRPEWLDVGSVKDKPRLLDDAQRLVFQDGNWKIWEYLEAYPRAFFAGNYEVISGDQEVIDRLYSDDFNPGEALILSSTLPESVKIQPDDTATVEIDRYTPMQIVFNTKSHTDQLLFLSDTYYPGWWAKIDDGKKQAVLMADFALRAVPVPAGEHTVTMWYFPDSFKYGLIVSAGTLISLVFAVIMIYLKNSL